MLATKISSAATMKASLVNDADELILQFIIALIKKRSLPGRIFIANKLVDVGRERPTRLKQKFKFFVEVY